MVKHLILISLSILISSSASSQKPGDRVISVYADQFGFPWFGTDNGLLRKCGDTWKAYPVQPDAPGIVNDIRQISSLPVPQLWIATGSGILNIAYDNKDLTSVKRHFSKTNKFPSDIIKGIAIDKYSTIFFATPAGIGMVTMSAWEFLNNIQDIMANDFTSAEAENDTIYFGTMGEGVARLIRSADAYSGASSFMAPWSAIPGNDISCIFTDSQGHQWYGSDAGLSSHTGRDAKEGWDDTFTKYLPDKHVNVIAEDKNGHIWAGTDGGLVRFDHGKSGKPAIFTASDGLPSDIINDIFFNPDGTLWIGTDLGASYYNGSEFKNFRTSDYTKDFPQFKKLLKLKKK